MRWKLCWISFHSHGGPFSCILPLTQVRHVAKRPKSPSICFDAKVLEVLMLALIHKVHVSIPMYLDFASPPKPNPNLNLSVTSPTVTLTPIWTKKYNQNRRCSRVDSKIFRLQSKCTTSTSVAIAEHSKGFTAEVMNATPSRCHPTVTHPDDVAVQFHTI